MRVKVAQVWWRTFTIFIADHQERHATINQLLHRTLNSIHLHSEFELYGLVSGDTLLRPAGVTLVPWANGRQVSWNFTCPNTTAPSLVSLSNGCAGALADRRETEKCNKYRALEGQYIFQPVAIETAGIYGTSTALFHKEVCKRLIDSRQDPKAGLYFCQRIAIDLAKAIAVCLGLGLYPFPSHSSIINQFLAQFYV